MIPLIALLEIGGRRRSVRLWLPLFLVWLLLLPVALLMLPFALLAMLIAGVRPFRATAALFRVLSGLCGLHVEVEIPGRSVLVHVY